MSKEEIVLTWFKSCNYKSGTAKAQSLHGKKQGFVKDSLIFKLYMSFLITRIIILLTFYTKPFIHSVVVLHCINQLPTPLTSSFNLLCYAPCPLCLFFQCKRRKGCFVSSSNSVFLPTLDANKFKLYFKHNYLL